MLSVPWSPHSLCCFLNLWCALSGPRSIPGAAAPYAVQYSALGTVTTSFPQSTDVPPRLLLLDQLLQKQLRIGLTSRISPILTRAFRTRLSIMATPESWIDPLARLPPIQGHPQLSPFDSPISSAPSSPGRYGELREKSQRILRNYEQVNSLDDTPRVLNAFLEHLCKDGQMTLMGEVEDFEHDANKLRLLRNFLVNAILKPSTLLYQTRGV